jgi:hypothetical protein
MRLHDYHGRYLSTHGDELRERYGQPIPVVGALAFLAIVLVMVLVMGMIAYISLLGPDMRGMALIIVGLAAIALMARGGGRS